MSPPRILFVDDDPDIQSAARLWLARRGFEVVAARDAASALACLAGESADLVLLDLNYAAGATSGAEGLALLADIRAGHPGLPVVVVTGHSGVAVAVAAMRAGAQDFVMKPWNNERLAHLLADVLARRPVAADAATRAAEPPMIGSGAVMRRLLDLADRIAPTRAPVLICGPPGSGKTTLARRIHARSDEVSVQVLDGATLVALPEPGDARGSLILRDIDHTPLAAQAALARQLEAEPAPRLLALSAAPVQATLGRLHPRLRGSLGIVQFALPPLSERLDDLDTLAALFAASAARRHRRPAPELTEALRAALRRTVWPQNLRDLHLAMERLVLFGTLSAPETMTSGAPASATLARSERALIADALSRHGFNVSHAARELGLSRPALYRRMARYGL